MEHMKFNDYEYFHPKFEEDKKLFLSLIEKIKTDITFTKTLENIHSFNVLRGNIETLFAIVNIRYTTNTSNSYYKGEKKFWDEHWPLYQSIFLEFEFNLLNSPFKDKLEHQFGKQYFVLLELNQKSFSKEILLDIQNENKLVTEYMDLLASAKVSYEDSTYNLSEISYFGFSPDREVRKKSNEAKYEFFKKYESRIDDIFDNLVKVRDQMAKKLGFENYIELGYIRMKRNGYGLSEVKNFRENVLKYIVPFASSLYEKQKNRLGFETLNYYDENTVFSNNNLSTSLSFNETMDAFEEIFNEISLQTASLFGFLTKRNLLDLKTRKNKALGGYCSYIWNHGAPFIFANFNNTYNDIRTFSHEMGHALHAYLSKWIDIPSYRCTLESAEVHSMGMELFVLPWIDKIYGKNNGKYKFVILSSAIKFIPYAATIDEFQEKIYENPNLTPKERKELWRAIEKKYLPHRDYSESSFLEAGNWWFQQIHIFKTPFYYIDYALAEVSSLQFVSRMETNYAEALKDYLGICNVGGLYSFLNLLQKANLKSPFEEETIKSVMTEIKEELNALELSI